MSKQCKACGAELPDGASFCPHCAESQIEKTQMKPPHPWRKKALLAALGVLVLAVVALTILLPHRPKTYDGGTSVAYTDEDGTYELFVTTLLTGITQKQPEEKRTLTCSADDRSALPALLGVFQDGALVDPDAFLRKVDRCTLEAFPNENGTLEVLQPAHQEAFAPATLAAEVFYSGTSGTNELVWTLTMKNGDTIRLRHTYEIIEQLHQVYTANDVPLDTMDDLRALLARIPEEVPADTVVDIYLPPETYEGDLAIASRAVNLYGCSDGSGRTVIQGSVTVSSHAPANVDLSDLDFTGSGGNGLTASASVRIRGCTFTGYDIGALVKDGGMIVTEACTFRDNGIGFCYNTNLYSSFQSVFLDCVLEDNGIGVQFRMLPGSIPLDFAGCVFSGNGTDIDNPISYPIETGSASFE